MFFEFPIVPDFYEDRLELFKDHSVDDDDVDVAIESSSHLYFEG